MYRRALRIMPGGADSNFRIWDEDTVYIDRGKGARSGTSTATSSSTCAWATARPSSATPTSGWMPMSSSGLAPWRQLQPDQRGRGPGLRADHRADLLRHGPPDGLGHRGDDARHAPRARPSRAATGSSSSRASTTASTTTRSSSPDEATELGDRADPVRIVRGRGIPEVIAQTMIPVPFNDLDALRRVFERDGEQHRGGHRRAHPRQRPGAPAAARASSRACGR